jgi:hypothetical protein
MGQEGRQTDKEVDVSSVSQTVFKYVSYFRRLAGRRERIFDTKTEPYMKTERVLTLSVHK